MPVFNSGSCGNPVPTISGPGNAQVPQSLIELLVSLHYIQPQGSTTPVPAPACTQAAPFTINGRTDSVPADQGSREVGWSLRRGHAWGALDARGGDRPMVAHIRDQGEVHEVSQQQRRFRGAFLQDSAVEDRGDTAHDGL